MKNKLGIVACSLFLAAGALCVAAVLPLPEFTLAANNTDCMKQSNYTYIYIKQEFGIPAF